MTEIHFEAETKTSKTKAPSKSRKPMAINKPQPKQTQRDYEPEQQDNYVFHGVVPNELKGGLKSVAITGLSYPAGNKKTKLAINLHQSTYTNAYLDRYLCIDMIRGLDDHSKMACVYLFNFLDAYMSPNIQPTMPQTKPTKEAQNDIQDIN